MNDESEHETVENAPLEVLDLHGETDAMVWAKEFAKRFRISAKTYEETLDLMIAWFANAIGSGVEEGRTREAKDARKDREADEEQARECREAYEEQASKGGFQVSDTMADANRLLNMSIDEEDMSTEEGMQAGAAKATLAVAEELSKLRGEFVFLEGLIVPQLRGGSEALASQDESPAHGKESGRPSRFPDDMDMERRSDAP